MTRVTTLTALRLIRPLAELGQLAAQYNVDNTYRLGQKARVRTTRLQFHGIARPRSKAMPAPRPASVSCTLKAWVYPGDYAAQRRGASKGR